MKQLQQSRTQRFLAAVISIGFLAVTIQAAEAKLPGQYREVLIPILGVTLDREAAGTVVYVALAFLDRHDHNGLDVEFKDSPGRFSDTSQVAVTRAIGRVAQSLGLSADSWSVELRVPFGDVTIYGESLSAMVGLSTAALASGEFIAHDRVITGTITADGRIGAVGSVPQKVKAAEHAHIRRVIVPDEQDPADSDWETPFLMQVSPVGSVEQAYQALTVSSPVAP